ncbi:hypothetical protein STCU_01410 [Strigomonas culicis]|uniref:Uncharacterized protein n=1 Tax=Strigomonas culicis TaxID=28005 RepID=S9UUU3_9TRYP|nr:hypothetical protein STCU_04153 [Strigomonas culicis]EPY34692.1 hypothetical protein STCU_01410 [Strigomonas culicis]|eukprot:EPY30265.1 hypothetical protein STCU_04153 [Strigomonas culicis]
MSGSSDEDEDVVVLQVCARCQGIEDLQFDEETDTSYCARCRRLFARTGTEGFRILLNNDDLALVALIFKTLDKEEHKHWTWQTWNEFSDYTEHAAEAPIKGPEDLKNHFKEEFDIDLGEKKGEGYVITLKDLENMYGGYVYNQVDMLTEDSEALEAVGILHTGILE